MKRISLTYGGYTLVNDRDEKFVRQWKWYRDKSGHNAYAARNAKIAGKWTTLYLHRILTKCPPEKVVDHKNHDGLDNRRSNLRMCWHHQNVWNQRRNISNTSGTRGVSSYIDAKGRRRWTASIRAGGRQFYIASGLDKKVIVRAARLAMKALEQHVWTTTPRLIHRKTIDVAKATK